MFNYLASASFRRARFAEAIALLRRAVELCRRSGPPDLLRIVLWNLGSSSHANGDHRRGVEFFRETGAILRDGDEEAERNVLLNNLSSALLHLGPVRRGAADRPSAPDPRP